MMRFNGTQEEYTKGMDSLSFLISQALEHKHASTGQYFRDFLLNQYNSTFEFNLGKKMNNLDSTSQEHFMIALNFLFNVSGTEIHNLFKNGYELWEELKELKGDS